MEGLSKFITILQGEGGSLRTPNMYYVIYGRPLKGGGVGGSREKHPVHEGPECFASFPAGRG